MLDLLKESDLLVEALNRFPGGQQTNGCYNRVRVTHLPSGLSAVCDTERSVYRNKLKAMEELRVLLGASNDCRRD